MNSIPNNTLKGPEALAASLLETIDEEHQALVRLHGYFDRQIEALRLRDQDLIDDATHHTNDEVAVLARLKQSRDRQVRLLGRVLRIEDDRASIDEVAGALQNNAETRSIALQLAQLRTTVRQQAARTQERSRDLEFALQYAVHLGRELLQTLQGINSSAGGRTYTANGGSVESSGTRSFVNKVG